MTVERVLHCDATDCHAHVRSATPAPWIPGGFLHVRQTHPGTEQEWHFCCWDCALKFAGQFPPPEVVGLNEDDQQHGGAL